MIKKGLNSFQLKITALVIMTIDHIAAFSVVPMPYEVYIVMRAIGRIAAPLFLFLLVEGLRHTKDRKKYILRLYVAGVIMQVIRTIYIFDDMGNIFQTFFYTALYITCIDAIGKKERHKIRPEYFIYLSMLFIFINMHFGHALLNIFCPSPFNVEYSFLFVLLGVAWYYVKNKKINCLIFIGLSVISGLVESSVFSSGGLSSGGFTFDHLFGSIQWLMVLAVPFMLLYNGEKGRGGLKYLFYIYYPAHQMLFVLIGLFR